MKLTILDVHQIGYSHKLHGLPLQDASRQKRSPDGSWAAVAVADGHGSASCKYSDDGSMLAARVFLDCMDSLYSMKNTHLEEFIRQEADTGIAMNIVWDWQKRVKKLHSDYQRELPLKNGEIDDTALYHLYGTTLIGMLITPEFHFAFQIGDGNITSVSGKKAAAVLEDDQLLGVETHSMCEKQPWKHARYSIKHIENPQQFAYVITTDGFKNSHASQEDYERSCIDYVSMLEENGEHAIKENLPDWLSETSEQGCGDDITMAIIYGDEIKHPNGILKKIQIGNKASFALVDPHTGKRIHIFDKEPYRNDPCPCGSTWLSKPINYKDCCGK